MVVKALFLLASIANRQVNFPESYPWLVKSPDVAIPIWSEIAARLRVVDGRSAKKKVRVACFVARLVGVLERSLLIRKAAPQTSDTFSCHEARQRQMKRSKVRCELIPSQPSCMDAWIRIIFSIFIVNHFAVVRRMFSVGSAKSLNLS